MGYSHRDISWKGNKCLVAGKDSGVEIIQDEKYPEMWRIKFDNKISDMVNKARAKDAAATIALRGKDGQKED